MEFGTVFHDHTAASINWLTQQYGVPKTVIELGVFEGHTTFNMTAMFASQYKDYKHYAIDPHEESGDLESDVVTQAGKTFRANLEEFDLKNHIEYIPEYSWNGLMDLYKRGVKADLIYVDGDHRSPGVLEDLVLGFKLLVPGGIMLCDDVNGWRADRLQDTPKLAVDSFIQCYWDKVDVIRMPVAYQLAFKKC